MSKKIRNKNYYTYIFLTSSGSKDLGEGRWTGVEFGTLGGFFKIPLGTKLLIRLFKLLLNVVNCLTALLKLAFDSNVIFRFRSIELLRSSVVVLEVILKYQKKYTGSVNYRLGTYYTGTFHMQK